MNKTAQPMLRSVEEGGPDLGPTWILIALFPIVSTLYESWTSVLKRQVFIL